MMNEKEEKLARLLFAYPHPNHDKDDCIGLVFCIISRAREKGAVDELIELCEKKSSCTFDEIIHMILNNKKILHTYDPRRLSPICICM